MSQHTDKKSPKKPATADKRNKKLADVDTTLADLPNALTANELTHKVDLATLPNSTQDITNTAELPICLGQPRANRAINTALTINASGYHIFAAGENGLGKRTMILRLLQQHAKNLPTPEDWVYVHNFSNARSPIAIALPAGLGNSFANAVHQLWLDSKQALNRRFRSDYYQSKIEAIKNETSRSEQAAYEALTEEGRQYSLELVTDDSDRMPRFVPHPDLTYTQLHEQASVSLEQANPDDSIKNNQTYTTPFQHNLNITVQTNTQCSISPSTIDTTNSNNSVTHHSQLHQHSPNKSIFNPSYKHKNYMQKRLKQLTVTLEDIEDRANFEIRALHTSLAKRTLQPLFKQLKNNYANISLVNEFLDTMQSDMIKHIEPIINEDDDDFLPSLFNRVPSRYQVNVVVSHEPDSGAPIVFEDMPTHLNLLGHVEQITHMGTISTDVSLIRAGALHRANGGFLVLEAASLLEHAYAWQGLKRALQSKHIKLSSLEQMLTLTGSISLAPSAIPLQVKVILLGEPDLYYELLDFEPEFDAVFKIRADFHDSFARTPDNELALVTKIADMIKSYQLLPFDNTALAAVIEYMSLQAEDQHELSLHSDRLSQVLLEANAFALSHNQTISTKKNQFMVSGNHVQQAINERHYRTGYLRELYWQELARGHQLIATQGKAIGQINALTVISYADSEFGMPARLTATAHRGDGDILDIERDVDLGGNIHAKGVLIMSSYLRALFGQQQTLTFTASLAFEQSYAHIDGDSATIAEACALISALAQVPISQALAVTGSMNQLGEMQAVGGINAKIAGFFDACQEQGLTGSQGVIIPAANCRQLMLRQDIIDAVDAGQFIVYPAQHITQVLTLLTGLPAGKTNKKGKFSKPSLFAKVSKRLAAWDEDKDD